MDKHDTYPHAMNTHKSVWNYEVKKHDKFFF